MPDTSRAGEIASQARAAAARQRMSYARLSTLTGIGRVTMQRKMRGTSEFTAVELERVAAVLGVPVTEMYDRPTTK